jgi:cob(I)alamin adenosyltransferase
MEHSVLMVYTGHREGASCATLGQAFRSLGRGLRVCVVQFAESGVDFRPLISSETFRNRTEWHGPATARVDQSVTSTTDHNAGMQMWQLAREAVESEKFELVILDGLLELLESRSVDEGEVIRCLVNRPEGVNVMITGGNASQALMEVADLVTAVTDLKQTKASATPPQSRAGIVR